VDADCVRDGVRNWDGVDDGENDCDGDCVREEVIVIEGDMVIDRVCV